MCVAESQPIELQPDDCAEVTTYQAANSGFSLTDEVFHMNQPADRTVISIRNLSLTGG